MRRLILLLCIVQASCATERFGREQHVTQAEQVSLSCEQIDLEIAKVDGFLTDVATQWSDTKGRRFGAFLVDFGIGNHREYNDAVESADARREQLLEARKAKQCPGAPEPRPEID